MCLSVPRSFEAVFRRKQSTVLRQMYKKTNCWFAADDATQDAFTRFSRNFDLITDSEHEKNLLSRVIYQASIDSYRKISRYRKREEPRPFFDNIETHDYLPLDILLEKERHQMLMECLDTLRPIYRDIIMLRVILGLSYEEIFRKTGIKEATLRCRCHRALRLLAKHPKIRDFQKYQKS